MTRGVTLLFLLIAVPAAARPGSKTLGSEPVPAGDVASWITNDDYPVDALRGGRAGIVNVTLAVDATGKPTDCTITESSGVQSLDDASCAILMARARFSPAFDGNGRPVSSTFHRRINWMLPKEPRELWTLDQVRFLTPKNANWQALLKNDHDMAAILRHLKALSIAFERNTTQIDTANLPQPLVARVRELPAGEPFVVPVDAMTTISVVTARAPLDVVPTASGRVPLTAPISTQLELTYDVDPDGKPGNCRSVGTAPPLMPGLAAICGSMKDAKAIFSPDPAKRTRHVVVTYRFAVTQSDAASAAAEK